MTAARCRIGVEGRRPVRSTTRNASSREPEGLGPRSVWRGQTGRSPAPKQEPMRVRTSLALAGLASLLLVPLASAGPHGAVVASANGGVHGTIPLPNAFGVEVVSKPLAFDVKKYADGSVSGHFVY